MTRWVVPTFRRLHVVPACRSSCLHVLRRGCRACERASTGGAGRLREMTSSRPLIFSPIDSRLPPATPCAWQPTQQPSAGPSPPHAAEQRRDRRRWAARRCTPAPPWRAGDALARQCLPRCPPSAAASIVRPPGAPLPCCATMCSYSTRGAPTCAAPVCVQPCAWKATDRRSKWAAPRLGLLRMLVCDWERGCVGRWVSGEEGPDASKPQHVRRGRSGAAPESTPHSPKHTEHGSDQQHRGAPVLRWQKAHGFSPRGAL